jgi:hypothetical protein
MKKQERKEPKKRVQQMRLSVMTVPGWLNELAAFCAKERDRERRRAKAQRKAKP